MHIRQHSWPNCNVISMTLFKWIISYATFDVVMSHSWRTETTIPQFFPKPGETDCKCKFGNKWHWSQLTVNLPIEIWVNVIVKCQLAGGVVADFRDEKNCNNNEHDDWDCQQTTITNISNYNMIKTLMTWYLASRKRTTNSNLILDYWIQTAGIKGMVKLVR